MSERISRFVPGCPACLAPPIDAIRLQEIESLIPQGNGAPATAMRRLYGIVKKFMETPRSKREPIAVPMMAMKNGKLITSVLCTPLEDAEVERIWDDVPWIHAAAAREHGAFGDDHCDQYAEAMDSLPQGPVRQAAWHLLSFVRELALDREPMTNDKLG